MTDLHPDTLPIIRNPHGFPEHMVRKARLNAADVIEALQAENNTLRQALEEIREEWAGAECGEPVYAQEAYAIGLAQRMYRIAAEALSGEKNEHHE